MSSVWNFSHSFLQLFQPIFSTCENVQGIRVSLGFTRSISGCLVYVWFTAFTVHLFTNKNTDKGLWGDIMSRYLLCATLGKQTKLTVKNCHIKARQRLRTWTWWWIPWTFVMFSYFSTENYSREHKLWPYWPFNFTCIVLVAYLYGLLQHVLQWQQLLASIFWAQLWFISALV